MKKNNLLKSLPDRLSQLPSPKPAAGVEAYELEKNLCLNSSKKKLNNYRKYLESKFDSSPNYLPIKMDIENVSRCNFRCTMCVVSKWDKGKRAKDLSYDDYKKIIDQQYGLIEIKLQGIGEPSLQKEELFKMIKYARKKNIWVRTTTNASLLHKNDNFKKYIDSDTNEIQISIDGASKKVFESIRKGGIFEKICENSKLINDYSKEKGVTRTKMWTVVQKKNYDELEDLIYLSSKLGFTNQVFSLDINGWGIEEWERSNNKETVNYLYDIPRFENLVKIGEKNNVNVYFWVATEKYNTDKKENLCPWPFERTLISSDLRVVPCCTIGDPDVYQINNENLNLEETWFGDEYTKFRESHLKGNIPQVCKACY